MQEWYNEVLRWQTLRLQYAARVGLPDLGSAKNNLGAEQVVRQLGRGGVLDKHMREQGLAVPMGPGSPQRDLLQLGAINKTNPRRVCLGIDVLETGAPAAPLTADHRIQIVLSWGTGKGQSSAIVDARHGAQIGLTANIINAAVRYLGASGPNVIVSASAGYGSRHGGQTSLTFTEAETAPLAVGAVSAFFRIPKYATRVAWVSPIDPGAFIPPTATLAFMRAAVIGAPVLNRSAPAGDIFVPIANGTDFIQITNNGGLNYTYRLVYEVCL